jgi:hypothetical protein
VPVCVSAEPGSSPSCGLLACILSSHRRAPHCALPSSRHMATHLCPTMSVPPCYFGMGWAPPRCNARHACSKRYMRLCTATPYDNAPTAACPLSQRITLIVLQDSLDHQTPKDTRNSSVCLYRVHTWCWFRVRFPSSCSLSSPPFQHASLQNTKRQFEIKMCHYI